MTRNLHPKDPTRLTALVAGILYLVTFIASIPAAAILLVPAISDPLYVVGPGADTQVIVGALLELVTALACIGTAVALFSVVKREHEGLALGFVTTRMYEAGLIMIGVVSTLALVSLRQTGAANGETAALVPVGQALVQVRAWTFALGPGIAPALNALMLATLLHRSRLVPRAIPVLGLIGAPLLLSSTIGTILGVNEVASAWTAIATVPIFFWELFLGLWMVFKGFDRSAAIVQTLMAESAPPAASTTPSSFAPQGVAAPTGAQA